MPLPAAATALLVLLSLELKWLFSIVLLDVVLAKGDAAKIFWNDVKQPTVKASKANVEASLDAALSAIPAEILYDRSKGNLLDSIQATLKTPGMNFKTLFDKDYELEPENKKGEPIGDGENQDGVAYAVRSVANPKQKFVLKVIFASKEPVPMEIVAHQKLSAAGTFNPAPAYPFIPKYITSGRSHDKPPQYDYVVMETAGINVKQWFRLDTKDGTADSPLRPNEEEIKRLVARTYWILKALHKAGYRHGDNHYRNWALSLTNPKVIFLFDFGRTKPLNGDYTWIARDWYLWADMVKTASMKIPFDNDKAMRPHRNWLAKLAKGLMTHLEKVLWRNPDNPVEQNAPYQELQAANHEAALALSGLKEFTKETEDFAKTVDGAALNGEKDLYRW